MWHRGVQGTRLALGRAALKAVEGTSAGGRGRPRKEANKGRAVTKLGWPRAPPVLLEGGLLFWLWLGCLASRCLAPTEILDLRRREEPRQENKKGKTTSGYMSRRLDRDPRRRVRSAFRAHSAWRRASSPRALRRTEFVPRQTRGQSVPSVSDRRTLAQAATAGSAPSGRTYRYSDRLFSRSALLSAVTHHDSALAAGNARRALRPRAPYLCQTSAARGKTRLDGLRCRTAPRLHGSWICLLTRRLPPPGPIPTLPSLSSRAKRVSPVPRASFDNWATETRRSHLPLSLPLPPGWPALSAGHVLSPRPPDDGDRPSRSSPVRRQNSARETDQRLRKRSPAPDDKTRRVPVAPAVQAQSQISRTRRKPQLPIAGACPRVACRSTNSSGVRRRQVVNRRPAVEHRWRYHCPLDTFLARPASR